MRDGTGHPYNRVAFHRFASLEVKLACDTAHIIQRSEIGVQRSELGLRMKEDGSLIMLPSIAPISLHFAMKIA
jgi:hypothetical protein